MKQNVTKSDFRDAFNRMDRKDQFSYEALGAIYDWTIDLEDDMDGETELDVIAICCEWCEYDNLAALKDDYRIVTDLDGLKDQTTVIELDNGGLVIMGF